MEGMLVDTTKGGMTWAEAFSNIVCKSIDKGVWPFILLFFIAIVILIRYPSEHYPKLVESMIYALESYAIWAYILIMVLLVLWFFHARRLQKKADESLEDSRKESSLLRDEIDRLMQNGVGG